MVFITQTQHIFWMCHGCHGYQQSGIEQLLATVQTNQERQFQQYTVY